MAGIEFWAVTKALILLLLANGAPVLGSRLLGTRLGSPLDSGLAFIDGRPLFGPAKTVRGLVLAVLATTLVAPLLGFAPETGALFGLGAMAGDLSSSFLKRRLGLAASSQAVGLDQLPESLLPLFLCREPLGLTVAGIIAATLSFLILDLLLSKLLYRLHIRKRSY